MLDVALNGFAKRRIDRRQMWTTNRIDSGRYTSCHDEILTPPPPGHEVMSNRRLEC
jgi:hypothetical protein